MMKKSRLSILILFLQVSCFAQTFEFAPVGAKWHYIAKSNSGLPTSDYIFTVEVIKDTIIEGKLCKKLNDDTLLYQNVNDSIFVYVKDDGFKLLYDLTKNVGETFVSNYCWDTEITVNAVSTININGGDRKVQEYSSNSLECSYEEGRVVEGIGYLDGYLVPHVDFSTSYLLQCYEDPFIGSFSFNGDACGVLNLKEGGGGVRMFSVFPTLFDDYIILESSYLSKSKILIFNSIGECIYMSSYDKKIYTSEIPKGLYILSIRDEKTNRLIYKQKLIKQ